MADEVLTWNIVVYRLGRGKEWLAHRQSKAEALAIAREESQKGYASAVYVLEGVRGAGVLAPGAAVVATFRHGLARTVEELFLEDQARGVDYTPSPADDLGEEL